MNRKGFSLVELLAVIAIMSILSGVVVIGVSRYLKSSRDKAYETMFESARDAANNYVLEKGEQDNDITVTFDQLVNEGFLENTIDPKAKNTQCDGNVLIKKNKNNSDVLDDYQYFVEIDCSGSGYKATKSF